MNSRSRRSFISLAGAGAATVGLAGPVGFATLASPMAGIAAPPVVPTHLSGSLTAYVDDVKGDSVSLMIGDTEVIVRDAELVARLANAGSSTSVRGSVNS